MNRPPLEVIVTTLAFIAFWVVLVLSIVLLALWWPRLREPRDQLFAQWQPALGIAGLFVLGMGLAGRGWLNPVALGIFCQAMIGLAVARGIPGYEPLPVMRSIRGGRHVLRELGLLGLLALLFALVAFLFGGIGIGIIRSVTGETHENRTAVATMPTHPATSFLLLLAGAGIAEETTFRLMGLSLLWRFTNRPRLAILLSAVLFGAYHLTPLSGMYRTFWGFPVSQVVASTLVGIVWGYAFVRRGYETVVLAHALSNWVPIVVLNSA
jgi:membrane protease YdiL (CAAX protease family)